MRTAAFAVSILMLLSGMQGCSTLSGIPALVSMSSAFIGGLANGAIFGGSAIKALQPASPEVADNDAPAAQDSLAGSLAASP